MLAQILNTILGIWLTAAPAVLDYGRSAATNGHITGPLVATFACIAIWEATRAVRWVNVPLGVWLVGVPLLLEHPLAGQLNSVLCGIAIVGLGCVRGAARHRFGGGWSALRQGVGP